MTGVLCKKDADKDTKVSEDAIQKKHDKRGIFEEGYGDFGGFDHGFEEDHHHVHTHHEKTIVDVKKVVFCLELLFLF